MKKVRSGQKDVATEELTMVQLLEREEELQKELRRISQEKHERFIGANRERLNFLRANRDVILSLLEHDRISCSDEHPCNGFCTDTWYEERWACGKCALIEVLDGKLGDDYEVSFDVRFTRIESNP